MTVGRVGIVLYREAWRPSKIAKLLYPYATWSGNLMANFGQHALRDAIASMALESMRPVTFTASWLYLILRDVSM